MQPSCNGKFDDCVNPTSREIQEVPTFSEMEEKELLRLGAKKDNEGKWRLPDGRQLLNKSLAKKMLEAMHDTTHWGA